MRRKISGDVIAGAIALVLILALAFARNAREQAAVPSSPSSYDTGRYGYAAFYDLLRAEHLDVGRFERDHHFLRESAIATLIFAQSPFDALTRRATGVSRNDVLALKIWVQEGGRLVVLAPPYGGELDSLVGIPASRARRKKATVAYPFAALPETRGVAAVAGSFEADFAWDASRKALPLLAVRSGIVAMTYPLGRGRVTVLTDPMVFANENLARAGNARFAVQVLGAHPGPIAFDETIHGFGASQSLWDALPQAARIGAVMAAFALLIALLGTLIRFAPPVPAAREEERDSSAYITSMANLLARAQAKRKALLDTSDAALRAVRRSLGVSERTPLREFLARIGDAREREAVLELDRLRDVANPRDSELLRAGTLAAQLRKETGT